MRWCLRTSIAAECVPKRFVVRCGPTKKVLLLYVPPFALLCISAYPMSSRKIVLPYVVAFFCPPRKSFAAMCCPRCLSVPPCITLSDAFGCEPKSTNETPCSCVFPQSPCCTEVFIPKLSCNELRQVPWCALSSAPGPCCNGLNQVNMIEDWKLGPTTTLPDLFQPWPTSEYAQIESATLNRCTHQKTTINNLHLLVFMCVCVETFASLCVCGCHLCLC